MDWNEIEKFPIHILDYHSSHFQISLQPDALNLGYWKLKVFDQTLH